MSADAQTPAGGDAQSDAHQETHRDAKDLRRGVTMNLIGYGIRVGIPVILVFVVRAYGAAAYGLFAAAQAVMMFVARICILGFDKALLWYLPQTALTGDRSAVRPALFMTGAIAAVASVLILAGASPAILELVSAPPELSTPLRIMALGLLPQVVLDLLVHAIMARRRMEGLVFIKDTLVPGSLVGGALLLHTAGLTTLGLPIAFVVSNSLGVVGASVLYRRVWRDVPNTGEPLKKVPEALKNYAVPMWGAEMANSFLQRVDTYAMVLFADLTTVGVYAVVMRLANSIRTIRRSFDPILMAIVSEIGVTGGGPRLTAGYSYATFLVTLAQLPILATLVAFAPDLLSLFGGDFESGAVPLMILSAFWILNGLTNLSGIVVSAYGRSKLTFINTMVPIFVLLILLPLLVPEHLMVGAAISVGAAYFVQSLVQLGQMRVVTGQWNYQLRVFSPLLLAAAAFAAMGGAWVGAGLEAYGIWGRAGALAAFAAVYGGGVFAMKTRGWLSR